MIVRPFFMFLVLVAFPCLVARQTLGETFVLQSGEVVEGRVVRSLGRTLSIKLPARGMRQLPINAVDRIKIVLGSGETIDGRLIGWSDHVYQVQVDERVLDVEEGNGSFAIAAETKVRDNSDEGVGGPRVVLNETENAVVAARSQDSETAETNAGLPLLTGSSEPTDEGAKVAIFSLNLSRTASSPIIVLYSAVEDAAKSGLDYHDSAGVVTIEAGEVDVDVSIPLIDDDVAEPSESFKLFLTVDPNTAELRERNIIAVILDND